MEKDGEVDYETLRKVLKEGKGSITDINLVLTAMFREAGFTAYPVRLSTRSHGKLHPSMPIARKFNYTICELVLNESSILLDASDKEIAFGVLPKRCSNGRGLAISATNPHWVELTPNKTNTITYFGVFTLDETGMVSGKLDIARNGYEALDFDRAIKKDGADEYKDEFASRKDLWSIETHEISDIDERLSLKQSMEITAEDLVDDLDQILYLNPIATGRMTENPFKTDTRTFPIDFGAPYTITHIYNYTISDQFAIESLPESFSIALPDNGGTILYRTSQLGNTISVTCKYNIAKSEFAAEDYLYLKEFYAQLVEKQGQQIVLKRI